MALPGVACVQEVLACVYEKEGVAQTHDLGRMRSFDWVIFAGCCFATDARSRNVMKLIF